MAYARAVIAAVLSTGLVIIVIIQEALSSQFWVAVGMDPAAIAAMESAAASSDPFRVDSTFLLLSIAIIILTVPDALGYWRRNRNKEPYHDGTDTER